MKRLLVFVFLGPTLAVFAVWLYRASGARFGGGGSIPFVFGLLVAALTGPIDGILAYGLPRALKASLTAIVGATVAVGLVVALTAMVNSVELQQLPHSPQLLMPFAVISAFCMGVCSLLAHSDRNQKLRPVDTSGSLS